MGKVFDFTHLQETLYPEWVEQFRSGPGIGDFSYAIDGPTSLYGTTDVLFCRAIMNDLQLTDQEKDDWAGCINQFQKRDTGWYKKRYTYTHSKQHTTAYAVAALHLIDRKPAHEFPWIAKLLSGKKQMERWIERIPWSIIWPGSHIVSGIPAILAMLDKGSQEFYDWYFDWLDREADPKSGYWCRGWIHKLGVIKTPTKHEMGGAFHMYYVYEFLNRSWRYPEKIIDHTLRLQLPTGLWDKDVTYCIDLDGIYCLTRSNRIAGGYREKEIYQACVDYLAAAEKILNDRDYFFEHYTNTHILPGALAAIAECQKFYPELVKTPTPWIQTLDRACFI